jgi:hypothetical protein
MVSKTEKEVNKKISKRKKENERMEKIYNDFANEVFKKNPELIGLTITGVAENPYNRKYPKVAGVYIANKL